MSYTIDHKMTLEEFQIHFPDQKFVTTMQSRYGCKTVGDLFASFPDEGKRLNDLKAFISANHDVTAIPASSSTDTAAMLKDFVCEYARTISDDTVAKAFSLYYIPAAGLSTGMPELSDLGSLIGKTGERIRQLLVAEMEKCRNILLRGEMVNFLVVNHDLYRRLSDADAKTPKVTMMDSFRVLLGLKKVDMYTERFAADLFGLSVSKDKTREEEIACRGNLMSVTMNIKKIEKFFSDYAVPCPEDNFKLFLAKEFKKPELREALYDYVYVSKSYVITTDESGNKFISLRWEKLQFLPSEIARILYDNKVFAVHDAWSKDQIVSAYNGLAKIHGIPAIDRYVPRMCAHPMVVALGKAGMYKLADYPGEKFENGQDYARKYVLATGKDATVADFLQACEDDGYIHVYGDDTMSQFFYAAFNSYMKGLGKPGTSQIPIDEMVEMAAKTLVKVGGPVTVSELARQIEKMHGCKISMSSLLQALAKADDIIDVAHPKPRHTLVSLKVAGIASIDFKKYASEPKARKANPYKAVVISTAVDELRNAPGHTMPLAELVNKLKSLIPSELAPNNIYKVFLDDSLFVKTPVGKNRYDVSLNPKTYKEEYEDKATPVETVVVKKEEEYEPYSWENLKPVLEGQYKYLENYTTFTIGEMLDRMYKIMCDGAKEVKPGTENYKILSLLYMMLTAATSINDRELLCLKAILGMEPYLKSLHRLHNGYELTCDGLGTAINKLQTIGLLPGETAYDRLGSEIYDKTGRIISRRNKLHENFEGNATAATVNFNTDAFLRYYILVAAYSLKKNN